MLPVLFKSLVSKSDIERQQIVDHRGSGQILGLVLHPGNAGILVALYLALAFGQIW